MAFGLLVTKWCILSTPIKVNLCNMKKLLHSCFRLHNYCIENREPTVQLQRIFKVSQRYLHPHEQNVLGYVPSDAPSIVSREGTSYLREIVVVTMHLE